MRRTIGLVALVAFAAIIATWWQFRPPSGYGSVRNHVGPPVDASGPEVPNFEYVAFDFDDEPYSIACMVRAKGPYERDYLIPWVREENGRVFVEGRRILPRRNALQVFIAEGTGPPTPIVFEGTDREVFDHFIEWDHGYEGCMRFWDEMESRLEASRQKPH